MATCKDCIHERVCVIKAFPDAFENTNWDKEPCDHFLSFDIATKQSEKYLVKENGDIEPLNKQSEKMVEVVRCCDCKYCEVVINDIICEPKYFCTRLIGCFPVDPTDYCSRAVKKGGE